MINVENLGIKFNLEKRRRVKTSDWLVSLSQNHARNKNAFWALRNVSFKVAEGETVGLIGRNGSGKSTLLRVIAGIYPPDEGRVSIKGRVSTLFSLGAGFQNELSGRDNIYLNGIMLGLPKTELERLVEPIIEFAGLGDFIESPVKHYSSGMRSRLGFAIAMHIENDILLIDEILGTGDASFHQKAETRLCEVIGRRTVLLVSHSMSTVQKLCRRVIWLDKGSIAAEGESSEVIKQYLAASCAQADAGR